MPSAAQLRARPLGEASLVTVREAAAQLRCRVDEVVEVLNAAGVSPVREGRVTVYLWGHVLRAFVGEQDAGAAPRATQAGRVYLGHRRRVG